MAVHRRPSGVRVRDSSPNRLLAQRAMRAIDVSLDDAMVIDCQGTLWVTRGEVWVYLNDDGALAYWDNRWQLPSEYEPYIALDDAVARLIRERLTR